MSELVMLSLSHRASIYANVLMMLKEFIDDK